MISNHYSDSLPTDPIVESDDSRLSVRLSSVLLWIVVIVAVTSACGPSSLTAKFADEEDFPQETAMRYPDALEGVSLFSEGTYHGPSIHGGEPSYYASAVYSRYDLPPGTTGQMIFDWYETQLAPKGWEVRPPDREDRDLYGGLDSCQRNGHCGSFRLETDDGIIYTISLDFIVYVPTPEETAELNEGKPSYMHQPTVPKRGLDDDALWYTQRTGMGLPNG